MSEAVLHSTLRHAGDYRNRKERQVIMSENATVKTASTSTVVTSQLVHMAKSEALLWRVLL